MFILLNLGKLAVVERRIRASLRQKFAVRALFDDIAVFIKSIQFASRMVERRCAMTKLVLPLISSCIALPISASVRVSTDESASSRTCTGGLHGNTHVVFAV